MKITLVNPPFSEECSVGATKSLKYVLNIIPPLGLAYLAAVLEKKGFQVDIIDCAVEKSLDNVINKISSQSPQIVGISATTPVFTSAKALAKKIREILPKAVIIIGGAHITAIPYQVMEDDCFDIGVIGEAEETIAELARHIQDKSIQGIEHINGIIFRRGKEAIKTPVRDFIRDLDVIPFPARHLLPSLARYRPTPASYRKLPLGVIITSRGCPQRCTFCDRGVFGNVYRQRSPENVLAEVEELINRYKAREIRFFDDCFTLDKERVYKICQGMKRLNVPWTCLTTTGSVTCDLLKEMRSAGCWQVLYGLESGDEKMLSGLKKGATLEVNCQAVKWAQEAGLSVRADFIVGTPGETEESLKKTLGWALKMNLDYAHFNKFVPYPGTGLYKELTGQGHTFDFNQGSGITDNTGFIYVPEGLKKDDYYRNFINYAYRKFYLRPGFIIRRLFSLRTFDEFKGQLKGFLSMVLLK